MIKDIEKKIEELKAIRERLKENIKKVKAEDGENAQFLEGYYMGERAQLLEAIRYLRELLKALRGE